MHRTASFLFLAAASLWAADYAAEGNQWWKHVSFLADDKLEGREVGKEGYTKAVAYVAGEFERIRLKPGAGSSYQQPISFERRSIANDQSSLELTRDGKTEPLALGADATMNARSEVAPSVDAAMVFVDHAFVIPENQVDNLKGVDLHGKIAVYFSAGSVPGVPGNLMSHYQSAGERWAALKAAGAIGIATINAGGRGGPGGGNATANGDAPANGAANGNPADGAAAGRGNGDGRGGRGGATPPPTVALADADLQDAGGEQISLTLTPRGAGKVLEGSGHTLEELQKAARANEPIPAFDLKGTLHAKAVVKREPFQAPNVVGVLPGSDKKLKNEYVIMSAHLDHLGIGRAINGDNIYNGAMDDASGVASVIEIARLMASSKAKLKRSVIFLTVAGEEKGELGSHYFAAHPTVPRNDIVADINLDMFLPLYPLKVIEVQGLTESSLGEQVRAAAESLGVKVQPDQEPEQNRFIRSDQYSFIKYGVPALAFKFG
ncbi:MAG TPA: M28 family peptidase, partial [Bryobacteraceae bacterium]|nr:M28 family peptidase [Bryobacteraceae bacterium]